ncbi:MAG: lysophospholipase [Cyclobacteriaceae bacterium]
MGPAEMKISASDGNELQGYSWVPKSEPKAVVCLIHGLGEHAGRYQWVADFLNQNGLALYSYDQRGHGRSPGKRGHARYESLLEDIESLLMLARVNHLDAPIFLYGHSWGGNLVSNFILQKPTNELTAAVLTSPWLKLSHEPNGFQLKLAKLMAKIFPSFTQSNGLDIADLSRDPEVGKAYKNDPLVHDLISAGLFIEVQKAGIRAIELAGHLKLPTLVVHGSDDQITSSNASLEFSQAGNSMIKLHQWPDMRHETHNEIGKEEVLNYTLSWMNDLLSTAT